MTRRLHHDELQAHYLQTIPEFAAANPGATLAQIGQHIGLREKMTRHYVRWLLNDGMLRSERRRIQEPMRYWAT